MEEIWKDIKGYEGLYQVSNLGRVKSLRTWVGNQFKGKYIEREKILKHTTEKGGYYTYSLYKDGQEKKRKRAQISGRGFYT